MKIPPTKNFRMRQIRSENPLLLDLLILLAKDKSAKPDDDSRALLVFFIILTGIAFWRIGSHLDLLPKELHFVLFFIPYLGFYLFSYFKPRFNCMVSTGPDGYRIKSLRKRVPKDQKTKYFLWEDLRHYYVDKVPKVGYQLHLFTNSGEETVFEDVNMRRFHNYLKLNFPEKNSGEE